MSAIESIFYEAYLYAMADTWYKEEFAGKYYCNNNGRGLN